jgi:FkbM family methyltransferase
MRVIYDVGSNNGDDIPYYLHKADLVVAIEANPALAEGIRRRFPNAINAGNLVVENIVITVADGDQNVPFYLHKSRHFLSQFGRPADNILEQFDEIYLPSKSLMKILSTYGSPLYIKIDVEGYDQKLLEELFRNRVFPAYLSAESHSIEVFAQFVANGGYTAFKLVDGASIPVVYNAHPVSGVKGVVEHSFPFHSAGPFGNDIIGPWERPETFFYTLAQAGLGWKDIHVSNVDVAER